MSKTVSRPPAEAAALDTFVKLVRASESVTVRSHTGLPKSLTLAQFGVLEALLHRGPLCASELDDISLEISVISPLKEIKETGEIEVGRHGLYIIKGRNRGVLLPQVAVEHNMDRECFLENTCVKAGLEPDAWKQNAAIFTFEAEILKEG